MVEGTGLENRHTCKGIESSNLSLSVLLRAQRAACDASRHKRLARDRGDAEGPGFTPGPFLYLRLAPYAPIFGNRDEDPIRRHIGVLRVLHHCVVAPDRHKAFHGKGPYRV